MATPEDDVLREMAGLLGAMTDARLDDTSRRRLAQLVREEAEARRLYLDYCQMHALLVMRWTEVLGGDVALEADVSAGEQWSLGVAVDGDSFEGYRIIFIAPDYPNGISVDSIYPVEAMLLAQDSRPIPPERDHTLRVEKRGPQLRVWVDRELRIDTELAYPLASDRPRTFAPSNFGFAPHIRSLRVWQAGGK